MFLKSKNIVITTLLFFLMLFYIEVVLVDIFFGVGFSEKASKLSQKDLVISILTLFVFILYVFNYNINTNFEFKHRFNKFKLIDIFFFLIILGFTSYLYYTKGIRFDASYSELAKSRLPIEDYAMLAIILVLYLSKGRYLITFAVLVLVSSYFFAGERLRMFVYLFALYMMFSKNQNSNYFRAGLFAAFGLAMLISMLRSNFASSDLYHISHFGGVTISSMYLLDYVQNLDFLEKTQYFFGILLGNLVPSSFLPFDFDIRRSLSDYTTVPGGGWLPIWVFATGGYFGFIVFTTILAVFIRKLSFKIQTNANNAYLLFFIYFVATLSRWFMYTPYQVIRFPLYILLMYLGYQFIVKTLKKE